MPTSDFDLPDARAGSDWLAREGGERRSDVLVALLSRFNHDVRTPLNTIVGWAHLLQQGLVDSARSAHVAEVLARNAREQTLLLDEYVDDARGVLGVPTFDPVALRLSELVTHAVERAAPIASAHGVSIAQRIDSPAAEVEGDERGLRRLVYRLLAGVVRRTHKGAAVDLAVAVGDGAVHLRIAAPVQDGDWSDAALLDLRVSSYIAALHRADLSIRAASGGAAIALSLPVAA